MSTLKSKLVNKKTITLLVILIAIAIICVVMQLAKVTKNNNLVNKSGLTNVFANVSTSAIKGYEDGVEDFLNLSREKSISFESKELENCYNITPDFVKENSEYKIFKFKDTAETYIVYENEIYKIGNNKRDRGTTSFALADINQDEKLELFYTYIWKVSEVSRTNVSYFDPLEKKEVGINKNYVENNAVLIKKNEELSIYNGTMSNEENYVDLTINARLESDVLVNDNGVIKPITRVEFEEIFSK